MSDNFSLPESPPAEIPNQDGSGTRVDLRQLTVTAGTKVLLEDASITFPAGELILLLGWSGVGKSVLLRILAGLIEPAHAGIRYTGKIDFVSAKGTHRPESDSTHPVAVVFQDFALLDELSPLQNVQIALDHTRDQKQMSTGRAAGLFRHSSC